MVKKNEKESIFVDKLIKVLSKYLKVDTEVFSDCRKGRIDIIVTTEEGARFGIECKRFDEKRGEKIGEFVKQAVRYSNYTFNGSKIPIFIAPPLSYKYFIMNEEVIIDHNEISWHRDRHDENHEHHSFNGFLGSLGIGELRNSNYNNKSFFYFSFSNKIIWQSKKQWNSDKVRGLHIPNYEYLIKKIKS